MGRALIILFQVRSLYVPTKDRSPFTGPFLGVPIVFRLHSKIGQIHLSIEAQGDHHIKVAPLLGIIWQMRPEINANEEG